METKTFYNEVLTDHNMHPYHKHDIDNADLELEGVNPSCGDDIILKLKFDDAKKTIVDGAFTGDGCAISQASAAVSYTHLRAHETDSYLVCRLLLEKKKKKKQKVTNW